MLIDPALSLSLALPVAALLGASAFHKGRDFEQFAATVNAYHLLPRGAGRIAAPILAAAEGAAAIGLLAAPSRQEAGLFAAALFIAYGSAMAFNLALGRRELDCGCGFGRDDQRISWGLVIRNAALALASLAVAAPATARPLGLFDFLSVALVGVAAAALYAGFEAVNLNAARAARGARLS